MHIPDGYLSPATCATLYAGAAPFWYVAMRRVRRQVHTRLVPVLSLLAAFSFVVMMFNVPLPGGTTGHAVGVGVAFLSQESSSVKASAFSTHSAARAELSEMASDQPLANQRRGCFSSSSAGMDTIHSRKAACSPRWSMSM